MMQEDAEAAIELVNFAYFKKVTPKPKKKVSKEEGSGEEEKRFVDVYLCY